jgi:hypothetical protein
LIDELLIQRGLSPLSDLGLAAVEPVGNAGWFDSAAGRRTIAALLASDPPTGLPRKILDDLRHLDDALGSAEASGIRFRLVIVAGTAMNARLWDRLRREGF